MLESTSARDCPSLPSGYVGTVLCGIFSSCFGLVVSLFMHLFHVYFLSMELSMVELSFQINHLFRLLWTFMSLLTFLLSSCSHGNRSDIHSASGVTRYIHIFILWHGEGSQATGHSRQSTEALDLWVSETHEQTPCPSPSVLLTDICIPGILTHPPTRVFLLP